MKEIAQNKKIRVMKKRLYKKTNSNAGAKSKLEKHQKEIIQRTREGASIKDRCGGLITTPTYYEWFNTGVSDFSNNINNQYSNFSCKIVEAEKEYREILRSLIKSHSINDWKAASWLLERSDPETYNLKQKMEVKQELEVTQKSLLEIPDNERRTK